MHEQIDFCFVIYEWIHGTQIGLSLAEEESSIWFKYEPEELIEF